MDRKGIQLLCKAVQSQMLLRGGCRPCSCGQKDLHWNILECRGAYSHHFSGHGWPYVAGLVMVTYGTSLSNGVIIFGPSLAGHNPISSILFRLKSPPSLRSRGRSWLLRSTRIRPLFSFSTSAWSFQDCRTSKAAA